MELSETKIRNFNSMDADAVARINVDTFGDLEYRTRSRIIREPFVSEGSFVAERSGLIIGCIGIVKLRREGWFEIRNLATIPTQAETASILLSKTVEYTRSQDAGLVKASTHAVQPYVDVYKRGGFEPIRRIVRVRWDIPGHSHPVKSDEEFEIHRLSSEHADEVAEAWLASLGPYWDWWIEEEGGARQVGDWVRQSVRKDPGWIGAFSKGRIVGLSILRSDSYGPGEARFNGAYVIPEYRGRGVGMRLMDATLQEAERTGQKAMRVYTLAYLDHLAPRAVLYLKSGGRIEAEYLQLQAKKQI